MEVYSLSWPNISVFKRTLGNVKIKILVSLWIKSVIYSPESGIFGALILCPKVYTHMRSYLK